MHDTIPPSPSSYRIVNQVLDSLDVRLSRNARPSAWLAARFPVWRTIFAEWEHGQEPHLEEVPGIGTFRVLPSSRPYEFTLANPEIGDIRIWNPEKWHSAVEGETGQLYVSFRSCFLQIYGETAAQQLIEKIAHVFCHLCGPWLGIFTKPCHFDRVARADLAIDVQEPRGMRWSDLDSFVTRVRKIDTYATLSDKALGQLLKTVLHDGKPASPQMGNKGVPTYSSEDIEQASAAVLACLAEGVREELRSGGEDKRKGKKGAGKGEESAMVGRVVSAGRQPQTVYFGRFRGELYARKYNKLASLAIQNKLYMLDVWKRGGWDCKSPVWRMEFSLSGDFLRHLRINDKTVDVRQLSDFLEYRQAIWQYLTHNWLRHTIPDSSDSNPWRWETSEYWRLVQSAYTSPVTIKRDRHGSKRGALYRDRADRAKQIKKQMIGCMITTAALLAVTDDELNPKIDKETGEILGAHNDVLKDMNQFKGTDEFRELALKRRRLMGQDDYTDSALSTLFRAERIAQGVGS